MLLAVSKTLKKEFEWFLENRIALLEEYAGKVLVIKEHAVIGVFDSEMEALQIMTKYHQIGTFLMQKCDPSKESYTQTFHSPRFSFS